MMDKNIKAENVIFVVLVLCLFFGTVVGAVGLGLGLVFLNITQSIGVGILSFGLGAFFAIKFGAKDLVRSVASAWKESLENASKNV